MTDNTSVIIVGVGCAGFFLLLLFLQMSLEETFGPLLSLRESIIEELPVKDVEITWKTPESSDQEENEDETKRWVRMKVWPASDDHACRSLTSDVISFSRRQFEGDRSTLIGFRVFCMNPSSEAETVAYREEVKTGPPDLTGEEQKPIKGDEK